MAKSKFFSSPVPHVSAKGGSFQPDLLVAIQDGKIRISHLKETTILYKTIRQMENLIEELKDIKWAQEQRATRAITKKKAGSK